MADEIIFKLIVDLGDSEKQIDAFQKKLEQLKKEMQSAFQDLKIDLPDLSGFGDGILSSLTGVVGKASSLLLSGFKGIFDGIVSLAESAFALIGDIMSTAFEGLKDSIKNSIELEDAMSGVKRTANLTGEQIETLTKDVREMSNEQLKGAIAADDLAKILETAGQRGLIAGENFEKTKDIALEFTKGVAMTAGALDLSFEKTADSLGKFATLMGMSADDIGKVGNAINILSDTTDAASQNIVNMAGRLAPVAAAFKLSAADTLGFSAAMDSLGVSSYTGATALQTAFKQMTSNIDGFAEVFSLDVNKLRTLIQTDIGGAFEYLLQGIDKMATSTPDGVEKVSLALKDLKVAGAGVSTALLGLAGMGTTLQEKFLDPATAGLTNMDSITKEFENTTSRASSLWSSIGEIFVNTAGQFTDALIPVFDEALTYIREIALQFSEWIVSQGIIESLKTSVISLWETGLKPLIASLVEWASQSEGLKTFLSVDIPAAIQSIIQWITQAAQKVDEWLPKMIEYAGQAWQLLKDLATSAAAFIQSLASGDSNFIQSLPGLFESVKSALEGIAPIAGTIIEFFAGIGSKLQELSPLVELFGKAWNAVQTAIEMAKKVTEPIFQFYVDMIESINTMLTQDFVEGAKMAFTAFNDAFKNTMGMLLDIAKSIFGEIGGYIKEQIGGAVDWILNKLSGAKEATQETVAAAQEATDVMSGLSPLPLNDISTAANTAASQIEKVAIETQKANQAMNEYGSDAVYNSVLPDVLSATQQVTNATQVMGDVYSQTAQNMSNSMGEVIATTTRAATGLDNILATMRDGTREATRLDQIMANVSTRQPLTPINNQVQNTTTASRNTTGTIGMPTTTTAVSINFQGQNIIDESSKNRFARQISQQIQGITGRSVSVA